MWFNHRPSVTLQCGGTQNQIALLCVSKNDQMIQSNVVPPILKSSWTSVCWKLYSISVWIQKRWFLCQKWWKRNAIWQTLSVDCGEQTYRMLWNLGFWLRNRNLIKCCKRNIPLFVKILWWCIVKRAIECSY